MADDQLFRVGQKAFIRRGEQVLVLFWGEGEVDFPGGGVQVDEADLVEALRREVREETGLEISVQAPFATWLNSRRSTYLVAYECGYLSGEVQLSAEHNGYRWVTSAEVGDLDDGRPHSSALRQFFGGSTAGA